MGKAPSVGAVGLLLCLLACGEAVPAEPFSVRDSAGVRVVENRSPLREGESGWRIDTLPLFTLGGALEPMDGFVREDGGVVVLDRMLPGLLFYDAEGHLIRRVGRKGDGPGEFASPERVFRYRGDSLGTFDARHRRIDIRTAEGVFVRSVLVRVGLSRLTFLGQFSDGSFVFGGERFEAEGPRWRAPLEVLRIEPSGEGSETIGEYPGREFYRIVFEGRPIFGVTPFGPDALVSVHDSILAVHFRMSCDVEVRGEEGTLRTLQGSPCQRRALEEGHIEAFRQERVSRMRSEDLRDWGDRLFRSRHVPYPHRIPPFKRLLHDSEGNLWVEVYPLAGDAGRRWWVFRGDGRWLSELNVPYPHELQWVGRDRVLVLVTGEEGVGRIQIHSLQKEELPG